MTLSYAQKMDGFQRVAHCSDVKLFFLVSGSRLMILVLMLSFRIVLPMIFGTELLWDSATLLYGDVDGTWGLLDFPRSWDGVHFFHIAKHGYSHENVCAFFPLVPSIIRIFSWVNDNLLPASWVIVPISFQVALLNVVMAGFAAIILRRITIITLMGDIASPSGKGGETVGTWLDSLPPPPAYLQSERVAENLQVRLWKEVGATVLMWMLSPTAVFGVVLYTESIFSLLTFLGVYLLAVSPRRARQRIAAEAGSVLCFVLAGCTRSNATIYVGYVLYPVFLHIFFFNTYRKRHVKRYGREVRIKRWPSVLRCVIALASALIIVMPYLALNYFCYTRFVPLWDESARTEINGRFWAFYSWIQRRYWDVGFLQSYRWGNTHVIISAPIVYFTVRGFVLFILNPTLARRSTAETAHVQQRAGCRNASQKSASGGARRMAFSLYAVVEDLVQSPSVICLMATLILGATMAHVNVVNRLVMSSPALYWLWGRQFVWDPWGGNTIVMLRVFVLWNCIGALFIPNGLPWT